MKTCESLRKSILNELIIIVGVDDCLYVDVDDVIKFILDRDKDLAISVSEFVSATGSKIKAAEKLGCSRNTILRYEDDTDCKYHHVYNGRLFTAKGSPA